jgi:hypothetical protein
MYVIGRRFIVTEEAEEKRLDELDNLFPKLMQLKQEEDLLLGYAITKYDPVKKSTYTLYPNGDIVYV